ncbi:hypothetical protein C1646_677979 [Rhizophagus diaphanus]|nr:hypothetical protein C1646_677979 [Rhizophagus diaphanus] [Rhizophagus sp. MUCL 43196]
MGRTRKQMPSRKNIQHQLPQFNLSEDLSEEAAQGSNRQIATEEVLDNDDDTSSLLPDPESYISSDNEDDSITDKVDKVNSRRRKAIEEEDSNVRKKTKFESTLYNMQLMQTQMFTIIQEIQKNVNEIYADVKSNGGLSQIENNTKWIEDAISQAIYTLSGKVKYPNDEQLMQVCHDALSDARQGEFIKIKKNGWKRYFNKNIRPLAQRFSRQARSNIVQRVKEAVHVEFVELVKPKAENRQVTHDEEQKFKNSEVICECYKKLNQPIDPSNDLQYTYLNSIIDRVFTNRNTEKNSIAFGMAVALNYLDPTKGINMVPSEIVGRMNYFLEKMQVVEREEYN